MKRIDFIVKKPSFFKIRFFISLKNGKIRVMSKKRITNWNQKRVEELAQAFLVVKNKNEFKKFIRDLCTLEEIEEMGKRWQAVKLLKAGMPYREVAKKVGLSTGTVARVAHWLIYGRGGYRLVLNKVKGKK